MAEIKRLLYKDWSNSQLSIARHYGSININGNVYEYDREVIKQMSKDTKNRVFEDKLYKPDLVFYKN